jgi:MFS family permease
MSQEFEVADAGVRSRLHVLLATWLGELFDGMDASIYVLVLFPALSELLDTTSHSQVGLVGSVILAVFMLGWACGAIVFGILADYIGRARTMVITILVYALCTGLCALSQNWWELAFWRFLVGCGIGGEISIGAVLLSECWRGRARLHATAVMSTSFGFGYLAAALINLFLGQAGWRWLFVAGIVPALLTVYIRARLKEPEHFRIMHEARRRLRQKPDAERSEAEKQLLGFTLAEVFRGGNMSRTAIVILLASTSIIGYWAVLSWIPAWINQLTGTLAVSERSAAAIALNVGAILAAAAGGFIIDRLGRARAFRFAFTGALASCCAMFLSVTSFGPALLAWAFVVGGLATLPFVFLFIYVPELFDTRIRGTAFGFSVQLGRVFAALAALAGGQLIGLFGGSYALAGASVATLYCVGIIVSFFLPDTTGEVSGQENPSLAAALAAIAGERQAARPAAIPATVNASLPGGCPHA